jgi:hypothetical protein
LQICESSGAAINLIARDKVREASAGRPWMLTGGKLNVTHAKAFSTRTLKVVKLSSFIACPLGG